ncbi:spermidine synthase [Rhodobaculum claviforme]|uniref:Spermidine synthase n=1 Tax=Rhodobaculum claviforme TaxID=1549854 RepID=A0A934TJ76_9RHOB|nr:spermidine synthase [Rhodobaculum claviforme]MBK5927140.1 spermidine synthase [Rhodobaculum claviforme]
MVPWEQLATARTPGGATLRLLRRGTEMSIRLADGNELMNSRLGGSEEALATLALAGLGPRAAPRVLIGGLGMGFTLRAAQAVAPPDARLVVAEIVPELIDWAGGHMAAVFGDCLSDPRVTVVADDVGAVMRATEQAVDTGPGAGKGGHFDAILLDVDNGPEGLTRAQNATLYGTEGLQAARQALGPGGVLAVWSATPDAGFARRLGRCGFDVRTHSVPAGRTRRGPRHTIWIARRPPSP